MSVSSLDFTPCCSCSTAFFLKGSEMKAVIVVAVLALSLGACAGQFERGEFKGFVPPARAHVAEKVRVKAVQHRVPVALAKAVTQIESRFRCNAVGPSTRYGRARGPMQIMPSSARGMFGFSGPTAVLATCDEGLEYGMLHLARCYELAKGDFRASAHCHVQGPGRDPFRPVNAYARSYGKWVMAYLTE